MQFAGLDVHKQEIEAVLLDEAGSTLLRRRFPTERLALETFARQHLQQARVALEATTNCWAIVSLLQPLCKEVVVSNPLRTRAIAEAKIKTDKVDALVLAQLLRCDYLPSVWTPDAHTRQLRQQATDRANLSHDRTRLKNRIHAVLHQRLIHPPMDDLFGVRGRQWLQELPLDAPAASLLQRELQQLDLVERQLTAVDLQIAKESYQNPQVKLLMTLPGVDIIVAQALLSSLGDITRFADADKAAGYLGLAPSTYQSGGHCYHGRITKQGASHTRWLLTEAAQHIGKHPGPLGVFFRRLAAKKNRNVAVVACARKLVTIAWHMLKNNEPYRYAQPTTVAAKLSRLRVRATGRKKKGGLAKGEGRPNSYGSGVRTRAVPALDAVYSKEQLPALPPPKPGERAMLQRQQLSPYCQSIQQSHRVPKNSSPPTSPISENPTRNNPD